MLDEQVTKKPPKGGYLRLRRERALISSCGGLGTVVVFISRTK